MDTTYAGRSDCSRADRVTRSLLGYGVLAGPLYVGVVLAQAWLRPGSTWLMTTPACSATAAWAGSRWPISCSRVAWSSPARWASRAHWAASGPQAGDRACWLPLGWG